jgi:hypothetical protein
LSDSAAEGVQEAAAELLVDGGELASGEVGEHFSVQFFCYVGEATEVEFGPGFEGPEFPAENPGVPDVRFVCAGKVADYGGLTF